MARASSTALLGLVFVAVAVLFDAEPLYVPGIALVTLAGVTVAWVTLAARAMRVERRLGARRVTEDEPIGVELEVRGGRVALPTGSIEDPLLPTPAPLPPGRASARVRINVRFSRRGRKRLAPPRVVLSDPLGLARRTVAGVVEDEVLVLPRVEPVQARADGDAGAGIARRHRRPYVAAEIDLEGLRPLRPGTPASRIFWPAVARGGELLERRLQAEADTRPLVLLDARGPASEADLDAAVRATASLCVHLARAGGCAVLIPGDRRPGVLDPTLAGWPHLHARLALVGPGGAPGLGGLAVRRGAIFYVTARRLARLPRALMAVPANEHVLVVPGRMPGRRSAFAVAGCHGYRASSPRTRVEVA